MKYLSSLSLYIYIYIYICIRMFSHSIWFKQLNHWNRFNQPNQSKPSNALNQSAALAGACLCHWSCAAALCAAPVAELIGLIRLNRLIESHTVRIYTYIYIYIIKVSYIYIYVYIYVFLRNIWIKQSNPLNRFN